MLPIKKTINLSLWQGPMVQWNVLAIASLRLWAQVMLSIKKKVLDCIVINVTNKQIC